MNMSNDRTIKFLNLLEFINMYQELVDKKAKLAVIGLGYVGLPIALEFAKKISVIGFDINAKRIEMMKNRDRSQQ